jgi:hypothetical protein
VNTVRRRRFLQVSLLALSLVLALSTVAGAVPAVLRTVTGQVLDGTLSGLDPVLRLEDVSPLVGPAVQYDIPVDSILEIWVDFPRVVIETVDHVFIGPYSAFSGIAQTLRVEQRGSTTEVPTTNVDAIALNGSAFHSLPREWTGQSFLVLRKPTPIPGTTEATTACCTPSVTTSTQTTSAETPIYDFTPTPPSDTSSGELPWWLGLIAVAALFVVLYLLTASGGAA